MKAGETSSRETWLSTGLTIHKEIMNSIKHEISRLVSDAKSTLHSFKVSTSSTVKELYRQSTICQARSHPLHRLLSIPQISFYRSFLTFLSIRFDKSVIPLTGKLFIPLHPVVASDTSPVQTNTGNNKNGNQKMQQLNLTANIIWRGRDFFKP